ncbi:MAG: hypothetical protein JXA71_12585 [Chitinispirillaceae bacterium]|nr:hypothetical protein [Chitinispirillaceae bacterium]
MRYRKSIPSRLAAIGVVSVTAALLSGCLIGPRDDISDEFARISSQEVSNMSANSSTMMQGSAAAKSAALYGDTIYYDWNIIPYAWDEPSGSYIRTATVTCSDGFERVRVDSVIFRNAAGMALRNPTILTVAAISHVRTVLRTKRGNEMNIRIAMQSTVTTSPEITHVKNGTISGTYNNEAIATGAINAVTRVFSNGRWQFPRSGTITADFPRRSYEAAFLGNGDAELTITNKATDKTRVIRVHVEER